MRSTTDACRMGRQWVERKAGTSLAGARLPSAAAAAHLIRHQRQNAAICVQEHQARRHRYLRRLWPQPFTKVEDLPPPSARTSPSKPPPRLSHIGRIDRPVSHPSLPKPQWR